MRHAGYAWDLRPTDTLSDQVSADWLMSHSEANHVYDKMESMNLGFQHRLHLMQGLVSVTRLV